MNEILEFMVRHGAAVLFAAVFVEQIGVPLPAAPWLLAAGALAATGKTNWFVALSAAACSVRRLAGRNGSDGLSQWGPFFSRRCSLQFRSAGRRPGQAGRPRHTF